MAGMKKSGKCSAKLTSPAAPLKGMIKGGKKMSKK